MKYSDYLGYVAGPYTANTQKEIDKNVEIARQMSAELWRMQIPNICPHMNCLGFEEPHWGINPQYFYPGTVTMLNRCNFMILANPDTEANMKSKGTVGEIHHCLELEIPLFKTIEELKDYVKFFENKLENTSCVPFDNPSISYWRTLPYQ